MIRPQHLRIDQRCRLLPYVRVILYFMWGLLKVRTHQL